MKPVETTTIQVEQEQEQNSCDNHQIQWSSLSGKVHECPFCTRDLYLGEVEKIQSAFKMAILAHENRGITGAGHLSYSGDFVSVAPCVTAQMKRWVRRWEELIGNNRHKKI